MPAPPWQLCVKFFLKLPQNAAILRQILKKFMGRGTSPPQTPPQADYPVFRLDHGFSVTEKNTPRLPYVFIYTVKKVSKTGTLLTFQSKLDRVRNPMSLRLCQVIIIIIFVY